MEQDVDIDAAVEWTMFGVFWTNGQICSSTSRLLVHKDVAERVLTRLVEVVKTIHVGDPFSDANPSMGPLVSAGQYSRVMDFVKSGIAEGARLLVGGKKPDGKSKGFFLEPTVFVDVKPHMRIWKEEIFGPVLSVMTFEDEAEALRLANDSSFGLGAAILSGNQERCDRFVRAFKSGIVWVNCSQVLFTVSPLKIQPCFCNAPWGGVKKSGIGRDLGEFGLSSFLEVKQVTTYRSSDPWGWFIKGKL
jgi:betaine-aldehyde dehydrogenase